jgi:hypothetical protein
MTQILHHAAVKLPWRRYHQHDLAAPSLAQLDNDIMQQLDRQRQ